MKSPKTIIVQRELEPLLASGVKYVAYFDDNGVKRPLYIADESLEVLKTRVLAEEPVAKWVYAYRINNSVETVAQS